MFLHEDLNIYTNNNFRSFEYLKSVWSIFEYDLIYILGMIKDGNITVIVDPGVCYLTVTSNFKNIFEKRYELNINHSLSLCDDFSIEIDVNIISQQKKFFADIDKCKLYFQKNSFKDEGIVELSATTNLSLYTQKDFKNLVLLSLSKEVQYSINRNIFSLDINNIDSIVAEIDAEYEMIRAYSYLYNKNKKQSLLNLINKNFIYSQNKKFLDEIINLTKNNIDV